VTEDISKGNERASGWWLVAALAAAILLTLPALRGGWIVDDCYHRWANVGSARYGDILPSRWDIFRFADGNESRMTRMMDAGLFSWWTYPNARGAFWRPVTSATHVLDYTLWPDNPVLMHAQSILWYAVLVACLWLLYKRLMGPTLAAGVAAVLFAVDAGHAMPVGMLAARNAVVSAVFGVMAIWVHDKWRRSGWRWGAALGPALWATSLLSAEAGMGVFAYILAYELTLAEGTWRKRLAAIVPYIAVGVTWQVLWRMQGYGVDGVTDSLYIDPALHPLYWARLAILRLPILLLGLFGPVPAELNLILASDGRYWMAAGGVVTAAVLGWVLWPILRTDRTTRFWAIGMLISLAPACGMAPQNRQMMFAGFGAMGLLGILLARAWHAEPWQKWSRGSRVAVKCVAILMIFIHGVLAPAGLGLTSRYVFGDPHLLSFLEQYPGMDSWTGQEDLVIVNNPAPDFMAHMVSNRELAGKVLPRHIRTLASAWSDVTAERLDDKTLLVRPRAGYLRDIVSLGRDRFHPMAAGQVVRLTGVTITVGPLNSDNRPTEARFVFDVPLEDTGLRWVCWQDRAFRTFEPPAVGQSVSIPGIRLRH
jgi:hypothetical protein